MHTLLVPPTTQPARTRTELVEQFHSITYARTRRERRQARARRRRT